jgi:hypothetical protein
MKTWLEPQSGLKSYSLLLEGKGKPGKFRDKCGASSHKAILVCLAGFWLPASSYK